MGLTRAKAVSGQCKFEGVRIDGLSQGLIVVGNRYTLENTRRNTTIESLEKVGAEHWRNLIRDLDAANAIVDLEPQLNEEVYSDEEIDSQNRALDDAHPTEDEWKEAVRMAA